METHYANVITVHTSQREIALVFGAFFAGTDRKQAGEEDMYTRIVMHPRMLNALVQVLTKARDEAKAQAQAQPDDGEEFKVSIRHHGRTETI